MALLVVEGLLLRQVRLPGGRSAELLGAGDVLAPWREDAVSFARSRWRALKPTRVAALDLGAGSPLAGSPRLCAELAIRAVDRSRALATQAAIMSIVGVEERLLSLMWTLAERWGRVGEEGVELELGVSQEVLAELVGARRPTVSMALGSLAERGLLVARRPGHWLLDGEPPAPAAG